MELVFFAEDDESQADLGSLYDWLKRTDQLPHSPVSMTPRPQTSDEMGGVADLILHLDVVEIAAFVSVFTAWLKFRGVDLDIERTADGGVRTRVRRAKRTDADRLAEQIAEALRTEKEAQRPRGNLAQADSPGPEDAHGAG